MANALLTPLEITREGLRILHQEASFIGNVNRQYDSRFAQEGAKIGNLLNVRMPAKYTTRTGAPAGYQDHVERSTPLYASSQIGVDVSFTTVDLTLSMDDFSNRVLRPAMSQLAAAIDYSCYQHAVRYTANTVGTTSTSMTFRTFQEMGSKLTDNLGPRSDRSVMLNTLDVLNFGDVTKGLFQSSQDIAKFYKEGKLGRTGGFDVYETTLVPVYTAGTYSGTPLSDEANPGNTGTTASWTATTTLNTDGWTSGISLAAGTVITFSGVQDVHPETKVATGKLKQFVITTATGTASQTGGDLEITISPALLSGAGNPYRNCSANLANSATITVLGVTATSYSQSLAFHKDAFAFVSPDLVDVSQYGAWGARDSLDGISMRLARQWVAADDAIITRMDVLYGFGALYPELACKHIATLT